jgi:hypothetical protein
MVDGGFPVLITCRIVCSIAASWFLFEIMCLIRDAL